MGKTSLGLQENLLALLTYFPYISLIVAIIVIIVEKDSYYCLFHGWQALFVIIVYIIGAIIFSIIDIFLPFGILNLIWFLVYVILWIILMITAWTRAESGEPFKVPLIAGVAASQAGKRISGGGGNSVAPEPDYTAPPPQNA